MTSKPRFNLRSQIHTKDHNKLNVIQSDHKVIRFGISSSFLKTIISGIQCIMQVTRMRQLHKEHVLHSENVATSNKRLNCLANNLIEWQFKA